MRFRKDVFALALVICTGIVFAAAPPGLWVYSGWAAPYSGIELGDTSVVSTYTVPVGTSEQVKISQNGYDTSEAIMDYFIFNYQFTKGFADFKVMWENRDFAWDITGYDSVVFSYQGPMPTHKVDVFLGETNSQYGSAFRDSIGSLKSLYSGPYQTSKWQRAALKLPKAPAGSDRTNVREIRFIFHNVTGNAQTSDTGTFLLDVIGFVKASTAVKPAPKSQTVTNNRMFFTPSISGNVDLSVFSLSGKMLCKASVPVTAGKKYPINEFSLANANLTGSQIRIVRINGAGINVQENVRF